MTHPNLDVINSFFEAYGKRDMDALRQVTTEDVTWHFPGRHPLGGTKKGVAEVVAFFDQMAKFDFRADRLVIGVADEYVVEAQRVWTEENGHDVEMGWCVLWTFDDGKLAGGTHFSSEQYKADDFFKRACGRDD